MDEPLKRLEEAGLIFQVREVDTRFCVQGGVGQDDEGGIRVYTQPFVILGEEGGGYTVIVAVERQRLQREEGATLGEAVDAILRIYRGAGLIGVGASG